jgi:hypothetical protein
MALHITDPAAEAALRRLAKARGLTLTRAIEVAANEALERQPSVSEDRIAGIREIQHRIASYKRRPDAFATHKEFFDWINEEK